MKIESIRILPSDKITFPTEDDFKYFVEKTMVDRGGLYYFPGQMMICPKNTFVLFQYNGMIRATGILVESAKRSSFDERRIEYAGYYKFDVSSLHYLNKPLGSNEIKRIFPDFISFNQSKQILPIDNLDGLYLYLSSIDSFYSNYYSQVINFIFKEVEDSNLEGKTKEAFIKVRVNQDIFRKRLLYSHTGCCICGLSNPKLLTASHIKPWSKSSASEKLDVDNGLLMCPNHDKLFDSGLISFDDQGKILISSRLSAKDKKIMNIDDKITIQLTEKNKKYLKFHREKVFIK